MQGAGKLAPGGLSLWGKQASAGSLHKAGFCLLGLCLIPPRVYTRGWMSAEGSREGFRGQRDPSWGDLAAAGLLTLPLVCTHQGLLSKCFHPQPRLLSTSVHLTSPAPGTGTAACCCPLPGAAGWRERGGKGAGRQGRAAGGQASLVSEAQGGIPSPHAQKSILPASVCKTVASLRDLEKHFAWRSQGVTPGNPTHTAKHFICQNASCKGIL